MSDNNLILQDKEINHSKEYQNIKINNLLNSDLYEKVIKARTSFNIIISKNSVSVNLDITSLKRIFSLNQLKYKEYITLNYDKDDLNISLEIKSLNKSITLSNNKKTEKDLNEETTEDGDEITVKEDDKLQVKNNKKEFSLPIKKRDDNVFDPNFPLLNNKIHNIFSNIDKFPKKYISLIICGNKAIINLDYLKCIYPTILGCGILNLLYLINIISKIYKNLNMIFHYFIYIPLSMLLIITGIYGYKKVKKNIYNDEFCMILTNLSSIAPIFSFALSLIYKDKFKSRHIFLNFLINFLSCFFAFSCIIMLKEVERMKN